MSVLFVLPAFITLFLIWRGRVATAFLSVYLPCLLILPDSYSLRIPHLPPFSVSQFALMPLGFLALFRRIRKGSFALMDALVVLYVASVSLSEVLHEPVLNDGIFSAMIAFVSMVLAYAAGRELIEPDLRFAALKRMVVLMLLNGPTNLYEWRMGMSPYGIVGVRLFGAAGQYGEGMQIRNGHGRAGYVFGGGESAGIAFAMAFCMNAWLAFLKKIKAPVKLGKTFEKLEKYHLAGLLLLLYVFATQSRGPEIALCSGILILQITRFKKVKLAMVLVAVLLVAGYFGTKAYFDSYTNVANVVDEQQSSAVYRKQMNHDYAPIAEAGGWTGYSVPLVPHIKGMNSIDNQYLLVHLTWGRLAYYFFILIALENVRVLVVSSWQFKAMEDRAFVISMLAAMAVLWITLMTVFLGSQLPQFSFLLLGWIQAAAKERPSSAVAQTELVEPVRRFSFRRVFT